MKVVLISIFLCVGLAIGNKSGDVSQFKYEHSCVIKGGYCVFEHECPHPIEGEYLNLCPKQESQGAVCCKGYPSMEKMSCEESRNMCKPENECIPIYNRGRKECPSGEVCCVITV
ncbi:uncharacterized protein [Diabrotica undecimpunctata]|uniref:uncharacterized protein n=1 Tax=Diabrotica undecimpunctata TaxID=50387 RepID=UPI003B63AF25